MTNITNSNQWMEVPQIEPDEFITGGEDGTANKQAKALVARDNYLKKKVEENKAEIDRLKTDTSNLDALRQKDTQLEQRIATVEAKNTQQDTALNGKFDKAGGTVTGEATFQNDVAVTGGRFKINRNGRDSGVYLQSKNDYYLRIEAPNAVGDSENNVGKIAFSQIAGSEQTSIKIPRNRTGDDCFMLTTKCPEFVALKNKESLPLGSIVAFPKAVRNPAGFLKCDGMLFNDRTYPDLYRLLGTRVLPKLNRSDVGQTAFFPIDQIPDGWIVFDELRSRCTQGDYPELYQLLSKKYGDIRNVPLAEDRYLRNAHGSLTVGQKQEDEIKSHAHVMNSSHPLSTLNSPQQLFESCEGLSRNQWSNLIQDGKGEDNLWVRPRSDGLFGKFWEGGSETRPKTLVLKLCIKAKNSFDDVNFWIKSANGVVNQALLDASTLSHDLQSQRALIERKAEKDDLTELAGVVAKHANLTTKTIWQGALQTGVINTGVKFVAGDILCFEFYKDTLIVSINNRYSIDQYGYFALPIVEVDSKLIQMEQFFLKYDWWVRVVVDRTTGLINLERNSFYNLKKIYLQRRGEPPATASSGSW